MLDDCTLALTVGNWRALELLKFPRMCSKGAVNSHKNELLNGKLFFLLWTKVGYFLNGPRMYCFIADLALRMRMVYVTP